ncbi:MAG: hypothetical protein QM817_17350 [Archangium sp.]
MKSLVTICDDALPVRPFSRLLRAVRALGRERIVAGYQTTFWFELKSKPSSLVEEAALILAPRVPSGATGVEWWLSRMRTSNVKVDFHRDRDNALWDRERVERHPLISSLLYLNACRGGLLAVTKEKPNPRNQAFAPDVHDFDFVEPRANRFTFFDGKLTHGVLDARNEIPGKRLPTERTWRLAIAINFWRKRPLHVPLFGETHHYRALSLFD